MKRNLSFVTSILFFALIFTACDKDDPEIPNEEELITTLIYTLSPSGGGTDIVLSFTDLDGDGGTPPNIVGGTLDASKTYSGAITLSNDSETPAEDITLEIEEEDEEHQFFFSTSVSGLSFVYTDQDADGNPVGLSTTLTTGAAGTGSITVILRHEPAKDASGVSGGDITNAGGETDIEVTFPIDVI